MGEGFQQAKVYSVPADVPFLKILVQSILDGTLLPDTIDVTDPAALASLSIYLPTQRSVRLLEDTFFEAFGGKAHFLPTIKALGDVEEDSVFFEEASDFAAPLQPIPPAISSLERQMVLTKLVMRWGDAMQGRKAPTWSGQQPLLVPASPADAAWLAGDLGNLLDRAISEDVSWDDLRHLVPDDYAAFWQMSLTFLEIVTESWPAYLKERGLIDLAKRRDLLIAQEIERLENYPGPVIAAGSTGTLPSTAQFLSYVAKRANGALVLPGLDKNLSEEAYEAMGGLDDRANALSSHPQYGMKQLLHHVIKIKPAEVVEIGVRQEDLKRRMRALSAIMLPVPLTDGWRFLRDEMDPLLLGDAFADVGLMDAKNDAEEARGIACALREFVETSSGCACLVTPDRALARRVALELRRWGLEVDDSAGRPLAKTAPAIVAQLIADCVISDFEPVALLALLKHPLVTFGFEAGFVRRAARVLDLAILRGPRIARGTEGLKARFQQVMDDVLRGTAVLPGGLERESDGGLDTLNNPNGERGKQHRLHPAIGEYREADWQAASQLLDRLSDVLSPVENVFHQSKSPLSDFAESHRGAFEKMLGESKEDQPAIRALKQRFETMSGPEGQAFRLAPTDYPSLFRALLGSEAVRETAADDPRILILGALEARLLDPDFIVLAALDEGAWPKQAETDAFMSRGMRAAMGLEAPERLIGLAAHDVCQGLGVRRVLLTRSAKRGGTPVVMSRWLQRFLAFLGEKQQAEITARGERYLAMAGFLDSDRGASVTGVNRPNPKPPVEARPTRLSITKVETWVRDPYAIYAEFVLGLKAIDPLGRLPDFASRGTIIHAILDRFNQVWDGNIDDQALVRLKEIGAALFHEEMKDFPDQMALWWPRFETIAEAYLNWEKSRDPEPIQRYSEVYARLPLAVDGKDFTLTGVIDRLDDLGDGSLAIIDFKTGEPPSARVVKSGLNAQLALEVLMKQEGAFDFKGPLKTKEVKELGWVKLDGRAEKAPFKNAVLKGDDPEGLGQLAKKQMMTLVRRYRDPDQGYLSRARPDFNFRYVGDYDHLARVKEWQLAEEGDIE